jgi:hypothetical protein
MANAIAAATPGARRDSLPSGGPTTATDTLGVPLEPAISGALKA